MKIKDFRFGISVFHSSVHVDACKICAEWYSLLFVLVYANCHGNIRVGTKPKKKYQIPGETEQEGSEI